MCVYVWVWLWVWVWVCMCVCVCVCVCCRHVPAEYNVPGGGVFFFGSFFRVSLEGFPYFVEQNVFPVCF